MCRGRPGDRRRRPMMGVRSKPHWRSQRHTTVNLCCNQTGRDVSRIVRPDDADSCPPRCDPFLHAIHRSRWGRHRPAALRFDKIVQVAKNPCQRDSTCRLPRPLVPDDHNDCNNRSPRAGFQAASEAGSPWRIRMERAPPVARRVPLPCLVRLLSGSTGTSRGRPPPDVFLAKPDWELLPVVRVVWKIRGSPHVRSSQPQEPYDSTESSGSDRPTLPIPRAAA